MESEGISSRNYVGIRVFPSKPVWSTSKGTGLVSSSIPRVLLEPPQTLNPELPTLTPLLVLVLVIIFLVRGEVLRLL